MKTVRCAIYTRKSSEEGLEQDFNSLDAQREACAAYVLSQASEGWTLLDRHYDDGGLSGGTLERPALQRLLADVKDGRIDIIVVYKVDRLTRSLLDFARLVETFDRAGTSFVSITQSFNTTTSMGRLTLNMLLSFAQFEREVTAERIRNKIAASKAKGMWMGGIPPLGYKPDGRSLAIVAEHAAIVRDIYQRYRQVGNVRLVADELVRDGIRTPQRTTGKGKTYGNCPFTRGQLYTILKSPVYAGDIPHKGTIHAGNHPAIIDRATWDAVQQQLAGNVKGARQARERSASLLAGLLFDPEGEPLVPVHATKGNARYRYYVSRAHQHGAGASAAPALRMPAREIEQLARRELATLLADPLELTARCGLALSPAMIAPVGERCDALRTGLAASGRAIITALVRSITVHIDRLAFVISSAGLARLLGTEADAAMPSDMTHEVSARLTRTGLAVRLVQDNGAAAADTAPDPTIARLLIKARRWWGEIAGGEVDIATLARREGLTPSWLTRVIRLNFLSPRVVEAVLEGGLKAGISGKDFMASNAIDASWPAQAGKFLPGASASEVW